ncbi:unnamed protein product [Moneuplotes crassus]|uniref:Uncharacterized protein n=1 Tax=Euplotes crassus TaxID=5936 RepID=A0AAD1UKV8_EUPCR|nr:unnamed protein product [Moneuplotes crassus]
MHKGKLVGKSLSVRKVIQKDRIRKRTSLVDQRMIPGLRIIEEMSINGKCGERNRIQFYGSSLNASPKSVRTRAITSGAKTTRAATVYNRRLSKHASKFKNIISGEESMNDDLLK